MKAVVFHKPTGMRVETVDDPKIEEPSDIILKVTSTAICGSDLHLFNGFFPQLKPMVMGHEFMGVVEEAGSAVTKLKPGDRVVVPFPIACGSCFFCNTGLPVQCENSNTDHYGPEGGLLDEKGGGLFGYTDLYGGYSGGQAEYVRVPYADVGPRKVPKRFPDDEVLFLTDIFPTGQFSDRPDL
jgi:S-(hydroxymethyl)glutathione dehydrogenase/alcohol dehydrogenase